MSERAPVFLRPQPRTGGTLFITMLDAHPELAMSYEIYEDRLLDAEGRPLGLDAMIAGLKKHRARDPEQWIRRLPRGNLRTFAARARRADVQPAELLKEAEAFRGDGGTLADVDGRLDLIDRLMRFRMGKAGKDRWGGKAKARLDLLHKRHPDASFFAMLRDGRDVLASQLHVGNFQTDALRCAQEWRDALHEFNEFAARPDVKARLIRYEDLARDPEPLLREVCVELGIEFDTAMLRYQEQDLALLRNPHGHASYQELRGGLSTESIGRWQHDLSDRQRRDFEAVNGDLLERYGYL